MTARTRCGLSLVHPRPYAAGARGFTLIESIVALVVVAIALLGPLKMMAHALASSSTANARNVAALHAASLASVILANPAFWRDGEGRNSEIKLRGGAIASESSPAAPADMDCLVSSAQDGPRCTPAQLAAADLAQWAAALQDILPNASGSVQCAQSDAAVTRCIVTLQWHERFVSGSGKADDSVSASTATGEESPRRFMTYLNL